MLNIILFIFLFIILIKFHPKFHIDHKVVAKSMKQFIGYLFSRHSLEFTMSKSDGLAWKIFFNETSTSWNLTGEILPELAILY